MIGNIGDTLETVRRSIEVASHFKEATFGLAFPIPRTALFDYVTAHSLFLDEPAPVVYQGRVIDEIVFATPEFTVEERIEAVLLAINAGVYRTGDEREGAMQLLVDKLQTDLGVERARTAGLAADLRVAATMSDDLRAELRIAEARADGLRADLA